jgi:hypothetical protein
LFVIFIFTIIVINYSIPEVPKDTAETNPIMRLEEFPKFTELNPSNIVSGCAKLSQEFDSKLDKYVDEVIGEFVF